jgi:formylglycine-generating enzyme required for sulfatase activity
MKRKLLYGTAVLIIIITACNNPFFPEKKGNRITPVDLKVPVISPDNSNLSDTECTEGEELILTAGVEGDEDDYSFQWYSNTENSNEGGTPIDGATGPSYKPPTDEAGATYYYVVVTNKRNGKTTTSKPVKVTVNPAGMCIIVINISGNVNGDTVTASPNNGDEGDTITLNYTVADTAYNNLLEFGGVISAIASVNSAGSGTRTYAINTADASNRVITIMAVFTHTNLELDPIAFTDNTGHITKTYGDAAFTNAVAVGHSGSGAITYSSSDDGVATVDTDGEVTIHKAGNAVIKAEKAADAVYAYAQANYLLTVNPKPVTISGLSADSKVYDGTATATASGIAVISGLVGGDTVTVSVGTAAFADKNVGTGKTVTFSGWSLSGADAGNYSLSAQPASVTANITAKSVTITGLSAGNKQYDGTTTATVTGTAVISGLVGGDTVTVNAGTAVFANAMVGNGKTVTFSGWSLGGADAGNYSLSAQPASVTANIELVSMIEMVQISAGTFMMGSPDTEAGRIPDEDPQHSVTLSGFYMGKYQVTQEQYQAVMGSNPSSFTAVVAGESGTPGKLPVERVNWYDAIVFCNKLSMMEGLSPAYSISGSTDPAVWGAVPTGSDATWNSVEIVSGSNGYRLPTEAQWEYACRAGTATAFNNGNNDYTDTALVGAVGWFSGNSGGKTHEVGLKAANAWGLYDMHGNVFEWCWDWYSSYSSSPTNDPTGAVTGSYRVGRGGYWGNSVQVLRSAARDNPPPSVRYGSIGFRLVRG